MEGGVIRDVYRTKNVWLGHGSGAPGPVTGGWSMNRDTGTSKAVHDILRQILNLSASEHRLRLMCLLVLGKRY